MAPDPGRPSGRPPGGPRWWPAGARGCVDGRWWPAGARGPTCEEHFVKKVTPEAQEGLGRDGGCVQEFDGEMSACDWKLKSATKELLELDGQCALQVTERDGKTKALVSARQKGLELDEGCVQQLDGATSQSATKEGLEFDDDETKLMGEFKNEFELLTKLMHTIPKVKKVLVNKGLHMLVVGMAHEDEQYDHEHIDRRGRGMYNDDHDQQGGKHHDVQGDDQHYLMYGNDQGSTNDHDHQQHEDHDDQQHDDHLKGAGSDIGCLHLKRCMHHEQHDLHDHHERHEHNCDGNHDGHELRHHKQHHVYNSVPNFDDHDHADDDHDHDHDQPHDDRYAHKQWTFDGIEYSSYVKYLRAIGMIGPDHYCEEYDDTDSQQHMNYKEHMDYQHFMDQQQYMEDQYMDGQCDIEFRSAGGGRDQDMRLKPGARIGIGPGYPGDPCLR